MNTITISTGTYTPDQLAIAVYRAAYRVEGEVYRNPRLAEMEDWLASPLADYDGETVESLVEEWLELERAVQL